MAEEKNKGLGMFATTELEQFFEKKLKGLNIFEQEKYYLGAEKLIRERLSDLNTSIRAVIYHEGLEDGENKKEAE